MTLQQIEYVSAVAHHLSMNKAAQSLFVSQPALSQSIKELEEEIGIVIFDRSRKGVSLTADGIEFLRVAKELLGQLDYIKRHYNPASQKGKISRFQVSSQHYAFVTDAFIKFLSKYDRSRYVFYVKETRTLAAIDDVYTHKSAVGVIFLNTANEKVIHQVLHKRSIRFHQCCVVRPHVFLSRAHPLAGCESIPFSALEPYPMLVFEQSGDDMLAEEHVIAEYSNQKVFVRDRGSMLDIIANTHGYNIGTGYLIPGVSPPGVTAVPLADLTGVMRIGWIALAGKTLSEEALRFTELLKESLEAYHPDKRLWL